jgi:hypothetical protein
LSDLKEKVKGLILDCKRKVSDNGPELQSDFSSSLNMIFGIFHGYLNKEHSRKRDRDGFDQFEFSDRYNNLDDEENEYISDFSIYNYFKNHYPKEVSLPINVISILQFLNFL